MPPLNAGRDASGEESQEPAPDSSRSARTSSPDQDEVPPWSRRDRFSVSLLPVVAIATACANALGSLLGPGWVGVGNERQVRLWLWGGGAISVAAAVLGITAIVSLVVAAVPSPRTAIGTRLVATFGAGLVVALGAAALGNAAEEEVLLVLAAGALWVALAGTIEALSPPRTRALGAQLAMLTVSGVARVGAWAIVWSAARHGQPAIAPSARTLATISIAAELSAAAMLIVYLARQPGVRAAATTAVLAALAFGLATWAVRTPQAETGTLRDAVQHALSLRVQGTGPMPSWIPLADTATELRMLEPDHRLALLPLAFAELSSIALGVAALVGVRRSELPLAAAMSLAVLSRGQLDTPMRAIAFTVGALGALVLARGARVTPPLASWQELRPPEQ